MLSEIRISRSKLERLFKILRYNKKSGKWKNKARAARELGISRPTIDKILRQYPEGMPKKPKKTEPVYFQRWAESDTAKKIAALYYKRELKGVSKQGNLVYTVLREAWKARGNKDPLTFDLEDFLFFFGTPTQAPYPPFIDPQTNKIAFNKAVCLRVAMRLGRAKDLVEDPRFTTKGLKREKGRKKHWYLEPEEIIRIVNCIREIDTLVLFYLGILLGGRFSALRRLKVSDIHRQAEFLNLYEPKVKKMVEKDLFKLSLEFVWQYIIDFDIKGKLFEWQLQDYNNRFKKASEEAGLPKEKRMTTHMLKHTCITQMSLHGVDVDVISEYVGTDAGTIMDFYRGGGRKKIRAQILGLKRIQKTWRQFIEEMHPYFVARYKHILPYAHKVDGIKTKRAWS